MDRAFFFGLSENIAEKTASFLTSSFSDLSRIAVVTGGKRPALFIKRNILRETSAPFLSPFFFSNDEFMEYLAGKQYDFGKISGLDACFSVYEILRDIHIKNPFSPGGFAEFLPWAKEIFAVMEQSMLEDVSDEAFMNAGGLAEIGFSVPSGVNGILRSLPAVKNELYGRMEENGTFSRGLIYKKAADAVKTEKLDEFDAVVFCGLFRLHKTETETVKELFEREKAFLFFQGAPERWGALGETASALGIRGPGAPAGPAGPRLRLNAFSSLHAEIAAVREALDEIQDRENTVILLSDPASLIPLAHEVSGSAGECNVSTGYPLTRSMFHTLFRDIIKARETSVRAEYYTKDYLRLLSHPFAKNMDFGHGGTVTRITVHKIEELLRWTPGTPHSGKVFINPDEIENSGAVLSGADEALSREGLSHGVENITESIAGLHRIFFRGWENTRTFSEFSRAAKEIIHLVLQNFDLSKYPLEKDAAEEFLSLMDEMSSAGFRDYGMPFLDIASIFLDALRAGRIALPGAPLKGLQILGFLETRLLTFKNVLVMDLNEGVLPVPRPAEPLLPPEILRLLGIKDYSREEEIQRYHFRRLLAAAERVELFYLKNGRMERSRFVEELIWEEEKKTKQLSPFPENTGDFRMEIPAGNEREAALKPDDVLLRLQRTTYSATSLNTYINCPLQFYFKYVQGLREDEDLLSEPEGVDVGRFVHELLENTFKRFAGAKPLFDDGFIKYFNNYFKKFFSNYFENRLGAGSFMLERVLEHRLDRFIENEKKRKIKQILSLEEKLDGTISINGKPAAVTAVIDRTDCLPGSELLVIDYKTGAGDRLPSKTALSSRGMKDRKEIKKEFRSIQLPLYMVLAGGRHAGMKINSCLYDLRSPGLKMLLEEAVSVPGSEVEGFSATLSNVIAEILDPGTPFEPDPSGDSCRFCPYTAMCG